MFRLLLALHGACVGKRMRRDRDIYTYTRTALFTRGTVAVHTHTRAHTHMWRVHRPHASATQPTRAHAGSVRGECPRDNPSLEHLLVRPQALLGWGGCNGIRLPVNVPSELLVCGEHLL